MVLTQYTTQWVKDFDDLKNRIQKGLTQIDYKIEHVGSTAVPQLDAKPIIDIDIIYVDEENFLKIKKGLENIGYFHNGNQGIIDRDVFKRGSIYSDEVLDKIKHHLYVCKAKSAPLERHLLLRNHLQKNKEAKLAYQQLKYQIAEKAQQDRKRYAYLKEMYINDFIDRIIEKEKMNTQST